MERTALFQRHVANIGVLILNHSRREYTRNFSFEAIPVRIFKGPTPFHVASLCSCGGTHD